MTGCIALHIEGCEMDFIWNLGRCRACTVNRASKECWLTRYLVARRHLVAKSIGCNIGSVLKLARNKKGSRRTPQSFSGRCCGMERGFA